jgi:hypothetical protein
MKTKAYRQCVLKRENSTLVSWIPEQLANVGQKLSLKGESGWEVTFASDPMPADVVEANARNHLKQRHASDVIFSDIKKENDKAMGR